MTPLSSHVIHTSCTLYSNYLFTVSSPPSLKYAHATTKSAYFGAVTQPLTNAEMRILEKESFQCFFARVLIFFFSFPVMVHSVSLSATPKRLGLGIILASTLNSNF